MSTRDVGAASENLAKDFLKAKGLVFVEANVRSPVGEVDLIFLDERERQLVFVEVKARESEMFGPPELAVTANKRYRIRRTAEFYMQTHPELPQFGRIDVVAIILCTPPKIKHFENIEM